MTSLSIIFSFLHNSLSILLTHSLLSILFVLFSQSSPSIVICIILTRFSQQFQLSQTSVGILFVYVFSLSQASVSILFVYFNFFISFSLGDSNASTRSQALYPVTVAQHPRRQSDSLVRPCPGNSSVAALFAVSGPIIEFSDHLIRLVYLFKKI